MHHTFLHAPPRSFSSEIGGARKGPASLHTIYRFRFELLLGVRRATITLVLLEMHGIRILADVMPLRVGDHAGCTKRKTLKNEDRQGRVFEVRR